MTERVRRSKKAAANVSIARVNPKRRPVHYSHRAHTAKRLPFHQTSYALLFFVILFTMGCMLFIRQATVNGASSSGDIQLSGVVPGPPPSVPAVINQPVSGQRFSISTTTVNGSCEYEYIVELYRNGTLAGSATCSPTNTFSIIMTLTPGENQLIVKTRDSINQYGPDSASITVFYDVPITPQPSSPTTPNTSPATPGSTPSTPPITSLQDSSLVVFSDAFFRVSEATKRVSLNFKFTGGQAPYEIVVRWGDGERTQQTHQASGAYELKYEYEMSGTYRVIIEVIDETGDKAVFQTIVIVDGEREDAASGQLTSEQRCQLDAVCIFQNQIIDGVNQTWYVFIGASILTLSFWFGEKVALHALTKKTVHKV